MRLPSQPPDAAADPRVASAGARRAASARGTISARRPNAAREALLEAAGVEVPDTSFVVICLALYLVALVPLNWLVFNAIGRVEWAWVAAPIIAIIGHVGDRGSGAARHRVRPRADGDRRAGAAAELRPRPAVALHGALHVALDDVRPRSSRISRRWPRRFRRAPNPSEHAAEASRRSARTSVTTRCGSRACSCPRTRRTWSTASRCSRSTGRFGLGRSQSQGRLQIENRSQLPARERGAGRADVARRGSARRHEAGGCAGMWIGELRPGESRPAIFSLPIVLAKDAVAVCRRTRGRGTTAKRAAAEPGADVPAGARREELRAGREAAGGSDRRGARRAKRFRRPRRRSAGRCWWWPTWTMDRGRNRCRISTRSRDVVRKRGSGFGTSDQ